MPTFYNFRQSGVNYSFDDTFVPSDWFREGNLWTWGNGGLGRLGNSTTNNVSTPITTSAGGANWKQVSSSSFAGAHVVAIKTDGTLWTWGYLQHGRLGNAVSSFANVSTPITTFSGGTNWKQASAGFNFTAAIKTDGTLWIWGNGGAGRLGNANTLNVVTPITTFAGGTNWIQVSGGNQVVAAIKTDGTLWTWGTTTYGRLGNGATTIGSVVSTPITTFAGGTNWKQVSVGDSHTLAIKTDGTLWAWGNTANGRLGNVITGGGTTSASTPVTTFSGGNNWKQASAADRHSSAIKNDGTLWTWGYQSSGRLGNGVTALLNVSTPITTFAGGSNWKQVSSTNTNTAAIKTDGTLWTWGSNLLGVLGQAPTATAGVRSTPVTTFLGGSNWKQVVVASEHAIAVTYDEPVI